MRSENQILSLVLEYFDIHKTPPQVVVRSDPVPWIPPREGLYKAKFYATFFENIGMAGIGVAVRDFTSNLIAALSQKIQVLHSVELDEALACSRAITFAHRVKPLPGCV